MTPEPPSSGPGAGMTLGYARAGTGNHTLKSQIDALTDADVDPNRIYSDTAVGVAPTVPRPGLSALLDYARAGDLVVVVGVDRLGRTTPEILSTARELTQRQIGLRSLREGLTTEEATGATIVGVLASLAELDDERRHARRRPSTSHSATSSTVGRPRVLDDDQISAAQRMRADGHPVPEIAEALGVSRATLYRTLAERRVIR